MTDPFVGQLAFFRVYSGHVETGNSVLNARTGRSERFGRILKMHANKREEISEVWSGDIAAAVGLKNVTTGDTICDPKSPIILESMSFPEPVIAVSIEPKTKADQEKLGQALGKLMQEDPTFRVHTDPDTGQTLDLGHGRAPPRDHHRPPAARVQGRGERRAAAGRLPRGDHHRGRRRGPLHPPDRRPRPVRSLQDQGLRPTDEDEFVFNDKIVGGKIPKEFIKPIEQGIREAMETGPLAGYPVTGVEVDLYDGSYHDVDSSEIAFKIAGSMAYQDGGQEARTR